MTEHAEDARPQDLDEAVAAAMSALDWAANHICLAHEHLRSVTAATDDGPDDSTAMLTADLDRAIAERDEACNALAAARLALEEAERQQDEPTGIMASGYTGFHGQPIHPRNIEFHFVATEGVIDHAATNAQLRSRVAELEQASIKNQSERWTASLALLAMAEAASAVARELGVQADADELVDAVKALKAERLRSDARLSEARRTALGDRERTADDSNDTTRGTGMLTDWPYTRPGDGLEDT